MDKKSPVDHVLIIPGYGGSGPSHWQTAWERAHAYFKRVEQEEWNHPACQIWVQKLETVLDQAGPQTYLVAHSLGCLLVAKWAGLSRHLIRGAFLVAPPDPGSPSFPKDAIGFSPVERREFQFPSLLVASSDDPFATLSFSKGLADSWGSRFVDAGPLGHINADSCIGDWPEGYRLFFNFISSGDINYGAL